MDEKRLEKLETNLVYMQDIINSLNSVVTDQTMEIEQLKKRLEIISRRLEEVEGEDRPSRKPPHY